MDSHDPMSSTPGTASVRSSPSHPAEASLPTLSKAMPRFPPPNWLTSPDPSISSDRSLPEGYTSWSSLLLNQSKKQKAPSSATENTKQPSSAYYSRRRAQNRASQRAFRERKERHVKSLERQLAELHQQYEKLLRAFNQSGERILSMEAELQDLHSENGTLRFPQNSPADFASIARYQNVQNNNEMTQLPLNELIVSHSQSLTPASALGNQSSLSRTSTSDEQTPFRALLPLTPTANFDDSSVYPLVDSFFASRAGSLGYGSSDVGEAQQQQEYDDFGSPSFNKGFVVHPTTDFFEGWR